MEVNCKASKFLVNQKYNFNLIIMKIILLAFQYFVTLVNQEIGWKLVCYVSRILMDSDSIFRILFSGRPKKTYFEFE